MTIPDYLGELGSITAGLKEIGGESVDITSLGALSLPSGSIVTCDALAPQEALPFELDVEPGEYPLFLGVSDLGVAFAVLKFNELPATRWRLATVPGDDPDELDDGEIIGFAVETGSACFVDLKALPHLESGADDQISVFKKAHGAIFDLGGGHRAGVFKSGVGDGIYASYWGFAKNDKPCCLLIDFALFGVEEFEDDNEELLAARGPSDPLIDNVLMRILRSDDLGDDDDDGDPVAVESATRFLKLLFDSGGLSFENDADLVALATRFAPVLLTCEQMRPDDGAEAVSEWLLEQDEVDDLFVTDDQLAIVLAQW